jgi:hypothetical protein
MTMPGEYRRASVDFDAYLDELRADTLIDSRNVVYTITQGVFQTFRRRLMLPMRSASPMCCRRSCARFSSPTGIPTRSNGLSGIVRP